MKDLEQYVIDADVTRIRCIDERPTLEETVNEIHVPGAVYGLVDALKATQHVSEDEAWKMLEDKGIPLDVHTDDHHEALPGEGCGYGGKVQSTPQLVGAPERVSATERYERAQKAGGRIMHYTGGHKPTAAVINRREGKTLNQKALWEKGRGTFVLDVWVIKQYAERLGVDADALAAHVEQSFRKTVDTLAGITDVVEFA